MYQYNLKSIEYLDEYIKLLNVVEDDVFIHLNNIEKKDRELRENDYWNDIHHNQFTIKYITKIQNLTNELTKVYYESTKELIRLRAQYAQII